MASIRGLFADTAPLRSADFRRLWVAGIVTVVGAQLTVVTVPAQIFALTGSSAMVGLTGLFGLVPIIVFGLWGGALADHMDRRRLLVVTTIGIITSSAAFFVQSAVGLNNVWVLLGTFSVQQAFFAVNQPTRSAILPKLIPISQLPAANALQTTVMMSGAIAGPLLGGVLMPVLGYSWLYLIDTVTLFATLFAVLRLPPLPVDQKIGSPGLRSIVDGFAYLRWHHVLLASFAVDLVAMIFGMPRALYPEIAHGIFGGPREGGMELQLLNAGIAIGAVAGGVFSGWYSRVRGHGVAVLASVAVWGVAICLFGGALFFAGWGTGLVLGFSVVVLAAAGAADAASAAFRQSILIAAADDSVRGRLQGVFIVVVTGGPRIADTVHGYASDAFGAAWTTLGGGLLVVLGTVALAAAVPEFRRYRLGESR